MSGRIGIAALAILFAAVLAAGPALAGEPAPGSGPAAPAKPAEAPATPAAPAEPAPAPAKTLLDKVTAVPYGFVQLAAAYDSGNVDTGNYARWAVGGNGDQFNATANATRIGLDLKGPELETLKARGKIEMDLYGGGTENKPVPMLRHAYLEVEWADLDLVLLAGQTWDVVAPLNPRVINYVVQWWAGNLGYRRPQLRLSKGFRPAPGVRFLLQAAAARTIGDTGFTNVSDAGSFTGEGRLAVSIVLSKANPEEKKPERRIEIGLSGHYADEAYATRIIPSWSACLDWTLQLPGGVVLKGEYWQGRNLDAFLGGIGQGIAISAPPPPNVLADPVDGSGGWIAVEAPLGGGFSATLGGGIDDPVDEDLRRAADRTQNEGYFFDLFYEVCKGVLAGLEASWWQTHYLGEPPRESWRAALMFQYSF